MRSEDLHLATQAEYNPLSLGPLDHRPGDHREFLLLNASLSQAFIEGIEEAGLPLESSVVLSLERRLLLNDAAGAGIAESDAIQTLNSQAEPERLTRELGGAYSSYLRLLTAGRYPRVSSASEFPGLPVPLRIYARLLSIDPGSALVREAPDQARRWEIASVLESRTMTEWGLGALLQKTT